MWSRGIFATATRSYRTFLDDLARGTRNPAPSAELTENGGEMAEDDHGDEAEVEVAPGETATLVYTFDEPGELLYGCHVPGHYAAGMVGTITVEEAV